MTNNNIYFVANWKMYGNFASKNSINNVIKLVKMKNFRRIRIVYCPPYTLLNAFVKKTKKTKIDVGAQNCYHQSQYGSCTGFINAKMIKDTGSKFVIIGHSESRKEGDTDKKINLKIKSALESNLKVIFCIGETRYQKKNKQTFITLKKQIIHGLKNIINIQNIIIAYEPIWSIGSGVVPNNELLKKTIIFIKKILNKKNKNIRVKIFYGGSVNSNNIKKLRKIKQIDGFLVGSASLKSKNFIDIIKKSIN
mgnify:CR=1 FL=1